MKRRSFIGSAAAVAAAAVIAPGWACARRDPKTGLILYTVRDDMAVNPEATLDAVAAAGYNWIEAAGYNDGLFHNTKPAQFRKMVESRGMSLVSSHNGLDINNMDRVLGDAAEAGLMYVVVPSLPGSTFQSVDAIKRAADMLNMAGKKSVALGMKAGFHNHSVEFREVEGEIPYDILLNNTDPELVCFELDLAWITAAGADPLDYFERYPGRFELLHVKDLSPDGRDATLGEGIIDFAPFFRAAAMAGMLYHFIEQDNCITHTPLETIQISRSFLIEKVL